MTGNKTLLILQTALAAVFALMPLSVCADEPVSTLSPLPPDMVEISGDVRTDFDENGRPDKTVVRGPVTAKYRNVTVKAEEGADVDHKSNLAVFRGGVVFTIERQEVRLRSLEIDLKTRRWSGESVSTVIEPRFAKGRLVSPLFAEGSEVRGVSGREMDLLGSATTTCNRAHQHYRITSDSISIYPDDKIVFRNVSMLALGRRVFTAPRFVVPLKEAERNPNLIPRVGQSVEEGYFIKTTYALLGTRTHAGLLLADLMASKGVGIGLRDTWRNGPNRGKAEVYRLQDRITNQTSLTGHFAHDQTIGTVRASLSSDLRANSYLYAPDSKSLVNQISLTRNRPGANTLLTLNQSINDSYTRSESIAARLRHDHRFGASGRLDTGLSYSAYSGNQPTLARLTSDIAFHRSERRFDWQVSAQKFTDLSDEAFVGRGGFGGVERMPELAITTDSRRLGRTLFGAPANLSLTYGRYTELISGAEHGRTLFSLDTPVIRHSITRSWTIASGGGFKQYAYGDGTAQYSIDASARISKTIGENSAFNLTYRLQKPRGYTPFRFDYVGNYNTINAGLDLKDSKRFRVGILAGYNFNQKDFPWNDVVLRMSFEPSNSVLLYTATGYDLNRSRWRTVINQLRIRAGDDFKLDVGTRYDTTSSRLATARIALNSPIGRKTRIEGLAGYNGFTKDFDYRGIAVTRDLHCWEATLTYIDQTGFYKNRGLSLNLRIKAFPAFKDFGFGAFGQALDTSVGQVY